MYGAWLYKLMRVVDGFKRVKSEGLLAQSIVWVDHLHQISKCSCAYFKVHCEEEGDFIQDELNTGLTRELALKSWTVVKNVCLLWIKLSIIKQWQSFIVQSKAVFTNKWYLYVKHNNILSMAVLISWNNKISSKTSPMVYDVYLFRLTLKISSKSLPGVLLSCLSRGGSSQMTLTGPLYLLGEFTHPATFIVLL